ncbi:helicase-exonuclease AddAB subunit AddB [Bacillus sp. EAC]|uniref:helicase-exonuclease AddAB subunit AddB n=1 Tax=Bacillus sp. EAC TaxID=1978338 RepID=UPI000B44D4C4|nr:helicase-exonuclease AddAB subunit AddB [Bacillus sp. EAC]
MSFQFILGRTGSGKTYSILNEMSKRIKNELKNIILIVPDQMTFQMEYELVKRQEKKALLNSQVFSFTRLAWKVLQETGGISRIHIGEIGISMILRKIIEERKEELKVFHHVADQQGFYKELSALIAEFKGFKVSDEELATVIHQMEQQSSNDRVFIQQKINDIQIVFEAFNTYMKDKYLDSEDYLNLLIQEIPKSDYLKDSIIYIDGYYDLAPQERSVVEMLMKHCSEVKFSLTLDQPYDDGLPHELNLFHKPAQLYFQMKQLALSLNLSIEAPVICKVNQRGKTNALKYFEENFDRRPLKASFDSEGLEVISAANRRTEVHAIARDIIRKVRDEGYRYRDIAIFLRNSDSYSHLISTIFHTYQIPIFIEEKRSMLTHPLFTLLQATFDIIQKNWRYEAIFTAYKTELVYPYDSDVHKNREHLELFENYCIAYGKQGKKWTKDERWNYRKYRSTDGISIGKTDEELEFEDLINKERDLLVNPILTLQNELKKAQNVKEMCVALYQYIESMDISRKLQRLKDEAESQSNLIESKDHDQVWKGFIQLLDECVELIGTEKMSRKTFFQILQTGFLSLQFANVPASLDQVNIADFDHSRLQNIKCAYILGVNEGVIPSKVSEDGLLGDAAREYLQSFGLEVAPTSKQQLFAENFNIYMGMNRASDCLIVSYPLANDEGKILTPSSIIQRIKTIFPTIRKRFESGDLTFSATDDQLSYLTNHGTAISHLVSQVQIWSSQDREVNMDIWWTVYNLLREDGDFKDKLYKVLNSVMYNNIAKPLGEDLSTELYGEELKGSVSRIELFHQCAYAHFARYGLQLQDREIYKFEAFDMGQLFHSALTIIGENLLQEGKSWSGLTNSECEELASKVVDEISPKFQREILLSTNRYLFLKKKMKDVISKVSSILSKQESAGKFIPIALEVPFGAGKQLNSYDLPIDQKRKMVLNGRIDRIDQASSENGDYLRILDYKSTNKELKLSDVYYGLALQLLTYLDIAVANSNNLLGKPADPAGILYFHVQNPIVDVGNKFVGLDDIQNEIFKKFKMNGLLLANRESNILMDEELIEDGGSSDIIPVAIKKSGEYTAKSKTVNLEQYPMMTNYIKQKFTEAGQQIFQGVVEANPYQQKDKIPCTYCSFKSVCQFDKNVKGNEYRILPPLKDDEALHKMIEAVKYDESGRK